MNSSSTASVTTPTAIPLSHQLSSASSALVDSGVGLNQYSNYHASIDNEDEVFIVENNGMYAIYGEFDVFKSWIKSFDWFFNV